MSDVYVQLPPGGVGGGGGGGGAGNSFVTIQPDAGTSPVADTVTDTLSLTSTELDITGDSTTDTITFGIKASAVTPAKLSTAAKRAQHTVSFDNGDAVLDVGKIAKFYVPDAITITGWAAVGDVSGSLVADVWADTHANYPPTIADTIAGTEKPTISAALTGKDFTLTTWANAGVIPADSWVYVVIESVTTIKAATITFIGVKN